MPSYLTWGVLRRLNKCGVISPRYDIQHGQIEDWVARLLPSRLVRLRCIRPACGHAETRILWVERGVSKHTWCKLQAGTKPAHVYQVKAG